MDTEDCIKKFVKVYQAITRRVYNNGYQIPGGGRTHDFMSRFVNKMIGIYGDLSDERIVDYCVSLLHYRRNMKNFSFKMVFGPTSVDKYLGFKDGKKHFENKWLDENGFSRSQLLSIISIQKDHPHSKYIYVEAEDVTKRRAIKLGLIPMLCARTTTMWTPFSPVCRSCGSSRECEIETERLFPELTRLRREGWQKKSDN